MSDLYISWSEYHQKIEDLAAQIYHSQWQFNQIVCLARGGLRVGDILSRIYGVPLAILAASSYGGSGDRLRGNLKFAQNLTMSSNSLGSRILLVDDLVDSGITLEQAVIWLKSHYKSDIEEIRTAVIWYKAVSAIAPDFYVDYLPDNPWIHQPFERYDLIEPAELASQTV
ncbi:phosphoribosyltransferase [Merismopedia glauca]|uniref:Phosphoribosyltransferase n=1 Tax=Merismopedia glauca CCAP 1448/3 TaxID=1296344 RepID=A0A2T1C251_9CYAN|nr:phosphoribosyltransferase family protein [Merismopedia glauca]PSB02284.1 phosphoribosyltransferase [Merismopedia glauca CCAP 1448/3]